MQRPAPRRGPQRGRRTCDGPPPESVTIADPVTSPAARPMTVEAMRAAVIAIRAGIFDDGNELDVVWREQASGPAVPVTAARPDASSIPWAAFEVGDPVVLVVAGHAGAGAS